MLLPHSHAVAYFDELKIDTHRRILEMVHGDRLTYELDWLDFKTSDHGKPERDMETWSEIATAMANSGGGIVIWGVRTKSDKPSDVDVACKIDPIRKVEEFVTKLRANNLNIAFPPIPNIEYLSAPNQDGVDGFVVCLIPASPFAPHQALKCKNRPYFIRAGDNTVVPSPHLLRMMFYPAINSTIELAVNASYTADMRKPDGEMVDREVAIELRFTAKNVGTSTSRELTIILESIFNTGEVEFQANYNWSELSYSGRRVFAHKRPLHPGEEGDGLYAAVPYRWLSTSRFPHIPGPWNIKFSIFAADREPQRGTIPISFRDLNGDTLRSIGQVGRA